MSHYLSYNNENYLSTENITSNDMSDDVLTNDIIRNILPDDINEDILTNTNNENIPSGLKVLENLKLNKPNNPIISYININSIRNKLTLLSDLLINQVDLLAIAETKLDDSFPVSQFVLDGFKKPYRLDNSKNSGGLLLYVRSNLPSRELRDFSCSPSLQAIPIELTLKDRKWLIISVYNPYCYLGLEFTNNLSDLLDYYLQKYDNCLIIGDMNLEESNIHLKNILNDYNLTNLIRKNTCFKSSRGTCIDLILTNKKASFQNSNSFETGLSDCHHLIYSMFRMSYFKQKPIRYFYRNFKCFNIENFKNELNHNLTHSNVSTCFSIFDSIFTATLNLHAPFKEKMIRGNHKPFVSKTLRKEIMKRAQLKNIFNKSRSEIDFKNYKKQRNFVVALNKKEKKSFFANIQISTDKKSFWKACKPFLSSKSIYNNEKITLLEKGSVVSDESKIANIFIHYFTYITESLDISYWKGPCLYENDPVLSAISKYKTHPSIEAINRCYEKNSFEFSHITPEVVYTNILNIKKGSFNVPKSILKSVADICTPYLTDCFNDSLNNCSFPDEMKWADITPVLKKGDSTDKGNYRPISNLPTISKVFERIIFDQMYSFFENLFSIFLGGFRKGFSVQHSLARLLKKWQACLDKKGVIGTVLIDLSKAYDCIQHDLLIAKLAAYGFSHKSLSFIFSYLSNRKQRIKLGSFFGAWLEVVLGVPQGSILGPLLFNIFINDLFIFIKETEICNFADDNTIYACDISIETVKNKLVTDIESLNNWFN